MKNTFRLISVSLFALGFILGQLMPVSKSNAVSLDFSTCPGDYYSFLLTARGVKQRTQFFSDLFTLGYCQVSDILELEDQLKALREGFRAAAMACEPTTTYKAKYNELIMEEYFVRNVQSVKSDIISEKDAEDFDALKADIMERLKKNMAEQFVAKEKRVSQGTLDTYFKSWAEKYDDRIGKYNRCDEGAWAQLSTTWTDFTDTLNDIHTDFDIVKPEYKSLKDIRKPETDVDISAEDLKTIAEMGQGAVEAVKSGIDLWKFYKANYFKRELDVENAPTIKDLSESGKAYTYQGALSALSSGEGTEEIEKASAERMARYQFLYATGGSQAATDMEGIIHTLNLVLEESNTRDLPNIKAMASQIYDKQCN